MLLNLILLCTEIVQYLLVAKSHNMDIPAELAIILNDETPKKMLFRKRVEVTTKILAEIRAKRNQTEMDFK